MRYIPSTNGIEHYVHCAKCIEELPESESPQSYRRYDIGFSKLGLQVWCTRHDCNIIHIYFEGQKHPANLD